jgi:hypothetical protein
MKSRPSPSAPITRRETFSSTPAHADSGALPSHGSRAAALTSLARARPSGPRTLHPSWPPQSHSNTIASSPAAGEAQRPHQRKRGADESRSGTNAARRAGRWGTRNSGPGSGVGKEGAVAGSRRLGWPPEEI